MAQISGIAHACINVSDIETSKKWYQEVLGLTLVFDPDTPINRIGCSHVAFAVENSIDELYKELIAREVEFYSPPQAVDVGGTIVKFC